MLKIEHGVFVASPDEIQGLMTVNMNQDRTHVISSSGLFMIVDTKARIETAMKHTYRSTSYGTLLDNEEKNCCELYKDIIKESGIVILVLGAEILPMLRIAIRINLVDYIISKACDGIPLAIIRSHPKTFASFFKSKEEIMETFKRWNNSPEGGEK